MSGEPTVGLVGSGPAVEAIRAAWRDSDHKAETLAVEDAGSNRLLVIVAPVGDERFERVNALRSDPWLAVDLGGIGGHSIDGVVGGVSILAGTGPCYRCLRTRVDSMLERPPDGGPAIDRADARLLGAHAGRLGRRWLDGEAPVGTVLELPYAERRLPAVPGCDCDGSRDRALDRSTESPGLERTLERAEAAVDQRFGPVASIGEAESFPAPYYLASVAETTAFSDMQASRQAAGVAAAWNPAFVKAVGEALERYSAGVYRQSTFSTAPANELNDAVPVSRFVRPEDSYEQSDPDDSLDWVPGEDLATGEDVHLPAERVHFPPAAERFGPAITTGLGLGTAGTDALVSGLTEVIERDATMLGWYSTYEPLGLHVTDREFDDLARRARAESLEVTALLMTQDIDVPVVTVVVHRDTDWPQFAVGSDAALDPLVAARGALGEAIQNWMELRGMGPDGAVEEEPELARYADFPPAAQAIVDVDRTVPATNVGSDEPPAGAARLPALLDELDAVNLDAYASRLTTRDVAAFGFEVVRVLIPSAQPLFTGERFFGERARTVPRELGFRPRLDRPPHPYP